MKKIILVIFVFTIILFVGCKSKFLDTFSTGVEQANAQAITSNNTDETMKIFKNEDEKIAILEPKNFSDGIFTGASEDPGGNAVLAYVTVQNGKTVIIQFTKIGDALDGDLLEKWNKTSDIATKFIMANQGKIIGKNDGRLQNIEKLPYGNLMFEAYNNALNIIKTNEFGSTTRSAVEINNQINEAKKDGTYIGAFNSGFGDVGIAYITINMGKIVKVDYHEITSGVDENFMAQDKKNNDKYEKYFENKFKNVNWSKKINLLESKVLKSQGLKNLYSSKIFENFPSENLFVDSVSNGLKIIIK